MSVPFDDPRLVDEAERIRSTFPDRLAETQRRTLDELARFGGIHPDFTETPLAPPRTFEVFLSRAIAIERRDGGRTLETHYLETMPAQHVRQLAIAYGPEATVFHARLDWSRLRRVRRSFEALGRGTGRGTLAQTFRKLHFGALMPLLRGTGADLSALVADAERVGLEEAMDRHLVAPLTHEATHGDRLRDAIATPYLDECLAAWLGTEAYPGLVLPEDDALAIFATPWFSQVGAAFARAFGADATRRAQLGTGAWNDVLPEHARRWLEALGWRHWLETRAVHFLPGNETPEPWTKAFHVAASGEALAETSIAQIGARPWETIATGPSPMDRSLLAAAIRAMCVTNRQRGRTFHVERRAAPVVMILDAVESRLRAEPVVGTFDRRPLRHFVPPPLAASLRSHGIGRLEITLHAIDAIDALATALDERRFIDGDGFTIAAETRSAAAG